MPKVNLNKSSKKKEGDFKHRKSTLGRGKHQHLSHTKIDLKTAKIKLLKDARFENTQVVSDGPTIEQLNNLINMTNHDTEKKIVQGFLGIQNIITKSPGLFVQNSGTIITSLMRKYNSSSEEVRKITQNLIQLIFNRFNDIMLPVVPTICRYISVFAVANSEISKNLAANLLDRVSTLHNLQPIFPIFQIFPLLIKSSPNPKVFSIIIKPMTKIIHIFASKRKYLPSEPHSTLNFPVLFPKDNSTFSKRFSSTCILTQDILYMIEDLLSELVIILPKIQFDDGHNALIELCGFLTELNMLNPIENIQPFVEFVRKCGWPFDNVNIKKNMQVAKFLAIDPSSVEDVRGYLAEMKGSGTLLAIVGGTPSPGCLDDADPLELCSVEISKEMQPIAFKKLINYYIEEEHPSKKVLMKLIELEKPEDFQQDLFKLIEKKLVRTVIVEKQQQQEEKTEEKPQDENQEEEEMNEEQLRQFVVSEKERERQGYIVLLIASCQQLQKEFFKDLVEFLSRKEKDGSYFVPDEIAESIAQAIGTGRKSKIAFILSFLYSLGTRRPELRQSISKSVTFMAGYARDAEEAKICKKLDLNTWTLN